MTPTDEQKAVLSPKRKLAFERWRRKLGLDVRSDAHISPPMDRDAILATEWSQRFLAECATSHREAVAFAMRPQLEVFIEHTNASGEWQYVVCPEEAPDFWMDALPTREAAVALCQEMGWRL